MRTDSNTSLRTTSKVNTPSLQSPSIPSNFTMVSVSSAEMLKRLQAGQLKSVKPCVYNPASHTIRLLVAG